MNGNGEIFFGLGRTWAIGALILVGGTVLFALGKLTADQWMDMVGWVFTVAGGKSTIVGVAKHIKHVK